MPSSSSEILERIRVAHNNDIDLSLRPAYADLLADLGNPEQKLKNVIHVAGTNGKGSVCAFLRAITEACGKTANVYTSPHLVTFHERIRLGKRLISEQELVIRLEEIETNIHDGAVSVFEAGTAAALKAFTENPADVTILEVGLGGRIDATNIVPEPIADIITRLSFDHRNYLGNTMAQIAREKAGILRHHVPCFTAPQPSLEALTALREEAEIMRAPLFVGGEDWRIEAVDGEHFRFINNTRKIENLPRPALLGTHQLWNAGLAIQAAIETLPFEISDKAVANAMRNVEWNARMQKLTHGRLADKLPSGWELWLDGGHNDSAGEVIAAQLSRWQREDGKPLMLVVGMLSSKAPEEFLDPLLPYASHIATLRIDGEVPGFSAEELVEKIKAMGFKNASAHKSLDEAVSSLINKNKAPSRILVCGSLYLAGHVLSTNASA
ncbi:MAG: folylpolyglutamate synthase/dihydrofolate synthase family protein [Bdellovibrionales bacterium]